MRANGNRRTVGLIAALTVGTFALVLPLAAQDGGESPEAVFTAAQKAASAKDAKAIVRLVAPSERVMLAFSTDLGVDMMSEMWKGDTAKNLKTSYSELKKKYKVPEPPEGDMLELGPDTSQEEIDQHIRKRAETMYAGVDLVGYVGDLMGLVLALPEMADRPLLPEGALSDLNVDGDKATAVIGEQPLQFVREGGRWYLSAQTLGG
jgi:hypothetical protein